MLYNVSFTINGISCANLIDANADKETAKEYFIQEHLDGDRSRFIGISESNESYKPGKPVHKMPDNWRQNKSLKSVNEENIMLNIIVINCDEKYMEYEWSSKKAFVEDMESDKGTIPMLDDPLAEVNTQDEELQLWWRDTDGLTVNDLLNECKREINM